MALIDPVSFSGDVARLCVKRATPIPSVLPYPSTLLWAARPSDGPCSALHRRGLAAAAKGKRLLIGLRNCKTELGFFRGMGGYRTHASVPQQTSKKFSKNFALKRCPCSLTSGQPICRAFSSLVTARRELS